MSDDPWCIVSLPEPYKSIWARISKWSAEPNRRVPCEPEQEQTLALQDDLEQFAKGRSFRVDSTVVSSRPSEYSSPAKAIQDHHRSLELVALFSDGSYWAVTEEEYEWFIFVGDVSGLDRGAGDR